LQAFYTIDAGPQVKVLCLRKDVGEVARRCAKLVGVKRVIVCKPGEGARLVG